MTQEEYRLELRAFNEAFAPYCVLFFVLGMLTCGVGWVAGTLFYLAGFVKFRQTMIRRGYRG